MIVAAFSSGRRATFSSAGSWEPSAMAEDDISPNVIPMHPANFLILLTVFLLLATQVVNPKIITVGHPINFKML